jgi:hypothetical protein
VLEMSERQAMMVDRASGRAVRDVAKTGIGREAFAAARERRMVGSNG